MLSQEVTLDERSFQVSRGMPDNPYVSQEFLLRNQWRHVARVL